MNPHVGRAGVALLLSVAFLAGCGKSAVSKAQDDFAIAITQASLADWVRQGGTQDDLLSNTNGLIDQIHGYSASFRRQQIDEALSTLSNSGCDVCLTALENARP